MELEKEITNVSVQLNNLPNNLRTLSQCLRCVCAVGHLPAAGSDLIEIVEETRKDATTYLVKVLPHTTEVIRSMEEFFGYYVYLDKKTWAKSLPVILEKVNSYQKLCTKVLKMYKAMMVLLKKRQDKATILKSRFENRNNELTKYVQAKMDEAENTRKWAYMLSYVPFVNLIATPLLVSSANSDMHQAMMVDMKVHANDVAISLMESDVLPALSAFIRSLTNVASFFEIMGVQLTTFNSQGEEETKNIGSCHYDMMKGNAMEIKARCKSFYAVIPEVQTDVQCIPETPLLPALCR